jgi:HEAT repeat protein
LVEGHAIAYALSDIQRVYVRVLLRHPHVGRPLLLEAIEGGSSLAPLALEGLAHEDYKGQDFLEVLAGVASCEEGAEDLRVRAVQVLGRIAPPESPWSSVLTAALSDRSARVRAAAAEAMRNR